MLDQNFEPDIFKANPQQIGKMWQVVIVIVGVLIVCDFIAASLYWIGQTTFHLPPVSPYILELGGLPVAALAGFLFYLRIKNLAPSESDKISVYQDRMEILKHGNSRSIVFDTINSVTAITNKYGIIFLQVSVGTEVIKIVGMTDLKGLFDSLSKRLPASKMIQENFLKAIGEKH